MSRCTGVTLKARFCGVAIMADFAAAAATTRRAPPPRLLLLLLLLSKHLAEPDRSTAATAWRDQDQRRLAAGEGLAAERAAEATADRRAPVSIEETMHCDPAVLGHIAHCPRGTSCVLGGSPLLTLVSGAPMHACAMCIVLLTSIAERSSLNSRLRFRRTSVAREAGLPAPNPCLFRHGCQFKTRVGTGGAAIDGRHKCCRCRRRRLRWQPAPRRHRLVLCCRPAWCLGRWDKDSSLCNINKCEGL